MLFGGTERDHKKGQSIRQSSTTAGQNSPSGPIVEMNHNVRSTSFTSGALKIVRACETENKDKPVPYRLANLRLPCLTWLHPIYTPPPNLHTAASAHPPTPGTAPRPGPPPRGISLAYTMEGQRPQKRGPQNGNDIGCGYDKRNHPLAEAEEWSRSLEKLQMLPPVLRLHGTETTETSTRQHTKRHTMICENGVRLGNCIMRPFSEICYPWVKRVHVRKYIGTGGGLREMCACGEPYLPFVFFFNKTINLRFTP